MRSLRGLLCFSMNYTGWRPVVTAYQWWPFAFCTCNYAFVESQIRPFCKKKQTPTKKIDQIFCLGGKSKQFYQPTIKLFLQPISYPVNTLKASNLPQNGRNKVVALSCWLTLWNKRYYCNFKAQKKEKRGGGRGGLHKALFWIPT